VSSTAEGQRILVVDDEPQIVRALKVILRGAGYATEQAESKEEALNAVSVRPPDAMVLDLVLPDGSGVDVCTEVRSWTSLPIIVLSAVGDEREKVKALDAGADDYITKPFGTDELLARLRAALRRVSEDGGEPTVALGALVIDLAARTVTRDGAEVHLTPIEFDLDETHYLRVHIAHIRSKIEPEASRPRHLITEPGIGYRLRDEP
jgi:two-component system, OmpR family, KDP operon response regulator KdpE